LNEPFGDLTCRDCSGDLPGLVFICGYLDYSTNLDTPKNVDFNVGSLSQGSTEKILVEDKFLLRKWERECTSTTPSGDVLTCFDNVGAEYITFLTDALGLNLDQTQDCLALNKEPSYRSPVIHKGFDFLIGGGVDIQVGFQGGAIFTDLPLIFAGGALLLFP
jgi:hypothetical protein